MVDTSVLLNIVDTILTRREMAKDGQPDISFISLILSIKESVILPTVMSPSGFKELWAKIENSFDTMEDGTFHILECTTELKLRSGLSGLEWAHVCQLIGRSASFDVSTYGPFNAPKRPEAGMPVIGTRKLSNVVTDVEAEDLVEANHWFVFVALATMSNYNFEVSRRVRTKSSSK